MNEFSEDWSKDRFNFILKNTVKPWEDNDFFKQVIRYIELGHVSQKDINFFRYFLNFQLPLSQLKKENFMNILSFLWIEYALYGHAYCNNARIGGKNLQPNLGISLSRSEYSLLYEGG